MLGLVQPQVICEKILKDSKLVIDGYPLYLASRTGDRNIYLDAYAWQLDDENYQTLQKLVKDKEKRKNNSNSWTRHQQLSNENLESLYTALVEQITEKQFSQRPNRAHEIFSQSLEPLVDGKSPFQMLSEEDKIDLIYETIKLTSPQSTFGVNLKSIGGSSRSGIIGLNKNITGKNVDLVNESVTGLFSKVTPLSRK